MDRRVTRIARSFAPRVRSRLIFVLPLIWLGAPGAASAQDGAPLESRPVIDVSRSPNAAQLRIEHDERAGVEVAIEAGGAATACTTPCELRVDAGRVTVESGRGRREITVGAGERYELEVDRGWDERAFYTYVAGWVEFIGGIVAGGILSAVSAATRDSSTPMITAIICSYAVGLFGGVIVTVGQLDNAGGGVRVRRDGAQRWSGLQLVPLLDLQRGVIGVAAGVQIEL